MNRTGNVLLQSRGGQTLSEIRVVENIGPTHALLGLLHHCIVMEKHA